MDHQFCPGSKLLRQPTPEIFACPSCGEEVEIWTDEFKASCPNCHHTVFSDTTMSCLDWCKYGKECVGDTIYDRYSRNKTALLKEKLLARMEKYFDRDRKLIEQARKVLQFAEELLLVEKADGHIVIPASILHDVGIKVAEEKYGSSAGPLQEKEGPPVAKAMLQKLGFNAGDTEQICTIIGHHHSPGEVDSENFRVLYDADCLVNMQGMVGKKTDSELRGFIERVFLTDTGKKLAMKNYFKQEESLYAGSRPTARSIE